jgi:LCP family protein required for cell wall assembly
VALNPHDRESALEYASSAVLDRNGDEHPPRGPRSNQPPGRGTGKKTGRRPKDPLWARLFVIFGALLMLTSGTAIIGNKVLFDAATSSFNKADLLPPPDHHVSINGAKNILLVGIDARPDQNPNDPIRADSVMIMHIPATHDRAYLVSIPRDAYVQIPAYDNGVNKFRGTRDKINAAFAYGGSGLTGLTQRVQGFRLLQQTIRTDYGIRFDAGAIVDFNGFKEVVEALGGVDMYVDEKTISVHWGWTKDGRYKMPYTFDSNAKVHAVPGVTPKVYNVGMQHLKPWEALDYVRQRELLPDGDYGRQRHQQQFLKALAKGILSSDTLTNPGKLRRVLQVVGKAMTVDDGHISMEDWIFAMRGISAGNIVTIKTNGGNFHSEQVGVDSVETLDPTSLQLMQAITRDAVDGFIADHADWVSQSG